MNLLIAPNGRLWDVANGTLQRYLAYFGDTAGLVTMATSEGYAAIAVTEHQMRIKLRPDLFSAKCFEIVAGILLRRNPGRILIDIDAAGVLPQMFGSAEDAVARLQELHETPGHRLAGGLFMAQPRDLTRIKDPRREALHHHYGLWRRRGGQIDSRTMKEMRRNPLEAGALYAHIKGEDVAPITWPRYMKLYKPDDALQIIGKPFHEHPDSGYMHAASGSYLATHRLGEAQYELAEALINPPNGPPRRLRYERLLLPWLDPDGKPVVSTISFMRSKTLTLPSQQEPPDPEPTN